MATTSSASRAFFDRAVAWANSGPATLTVEYDADYFFPTKIAKDPSTTYVDDEIQLLVTEFKAGVD